MQPVPAAAVEVLPGFWLDRMAANRRGITALHDRLVEHGVVDNFRPGVERRGLWFTDSDLYKWIEAASVSLARVPDTDLAARLDDVVAAVVGAQSPDGYLNTNFTGDARFRDLAWSHELYCAGHLIQAGIAHRRLEAGSPLYDAAVRFADLLVDTFGPGGRDDRDKHPVVEMALVALARESDDPRYRALAASFGDRVPHDDWSRLWGHAVCALYFASGVTDLALDGDSARVPSLQRWWDDLLATSSYVTGGVGGRWVAESMGRPFELPNEGAYSESCAAVASAQWAWRMLRLTGDVRAADHLELVLHNALLASMSLNGDEWFYANPLASSAVAEEQPFIGDDLGIQIAGPFPLTRRPWRDVTCCPANVGRTIAAVPAYAYLAGERELRVALYLPSRVRAGGFDVTVETGMPWSGDVRITVHAAPEGDASLVLRVPSWSTAADAGTWRVLRRTWTPGEVVDLDLGVEGFLVECDPRVAENRGAVAVRRGPFVYCAEGVDHPAVDLGRVVLDRVRDVRWDADLLGGVVTIAADAHAGSWDRPLYAPVAGALDTGERVALTLVPYFAWANRGVGPMTVWLRGGEHVAR